MVRKGIQVLKKLVLKIAGYDCMPSADEIIGDIVDPSFAALLITSRDSIDDKNETERGDN